MEMVINNYPQNVAAVYKIQSSQDSRATGFTTECVLFLDIFGFALQRAPSHQLIRHRGS